MDRKNFRQATALEAIAIADAEQCADEIISICGLGSLLDVGSDAQRLVTALCARGMDAYGIDPSNDAPADAAAHVRSRRFTDGKIDLPSNSVDIVTSLHYLNRASEGDIDRLLHEMFRVAKRAIYLRLSVSEGPDEKIGLRDRAWWETKLIRAGFRKHPRYYALIDYVGLEREAGNFAVVLEKPPAAVLKRYPLSALAEERDLHMDMAREQGRRSDAHMIRYHEAARYIRPGDRVLDAACGLGYGAHVLSQNTLASQIIGIDASDYAIDYATASYASKGSRVSFRKGMLPDAILDLPAGSIDFIASFETLEHLEDPDAFLQACSRVLSPGGRLMVSVPHDWSDESGEDPNPHHFHLYDWDKLLQEVGSEFLLEQAFLQSASRKKVEGQWQVAPREWRALPVDQAPGETCEWCLVLAMRSPLRDADQPYEERLFPAAAVKPNPALLDFAHQYENPWLVRSMISIGPRMSDPLKLEEIADSVLADGSDSPDVAAALCVKAYRALDKGQTSTDVWDLLQKCAPFIELKDSDTPSPISVRWAVSLSYVKALLELRAGDHDAARASFEQCAKLPFWLYSPLLATKVVDAAFRLGVLLHTYTEPEEARRWWRFGLDAAQRALHSNWTESFGSLDAPPDFAMRELTLVLDLATRCATGLSTIDELPDNLAALERVFYNNGKHIRDLERTLSLTAAAHDAIVADRARLEARIQKLSTNEARDLVSLEADVQRLSQELVHERVTIAEERRKHDAAVNRLNTTSLLARAEAARLRAQLENEKSASRQRLRYLESSTSAATRRIAILEAMLGEERTTSQSYRGWVPSYRWLIGHLRRKAQGRGTPLLPELSIKDELDPAPIEQAPTGPQVPFDEDRWLLEHSGLFDAEWYLAQNPDVVGVDPYFHYLYHGAFEGRSAGPKFNGAWYLSQNPDVAASGLNPLVHYIRYGSTEGRTPGPEPSVMKTAAQVVADVMALDPDVAHSAALRDIHRLPLNFSLVKDRLFLAWKALFDSLTHPYEYIVFVPWLTRGGADLAAVNAARAAIELNGHERVLFVVTDYDRMEAQDWLPQNTHLQCFSSFDASLTPEERTRLVEILVMALRPKAIFNVNSFACWEAIRRKGQALSNMADIHVSLFCRDYTPDGRAAGYSDTHFRSCLPFVKTAYLDNETFLKQLVQEFGIPPEMQSKMTVLRQPILQAATQRRLLIARDNGPMPVLWAGRFSQQKNVELLLSIVATMPELHFDVYGQGDEFYTKKIEEAAARYHNLSLKGAFSSFAALPTDQYGAFLYTSLWDGIPTVLINAGALGIPIVASAAGGIPELVDEETGWLVRDLSNPQAYASALQDIRNDPEEAARRVAGMAARIQHQHTWDAYLGRIASPSAFLN